MRIAGLQRSSLIDFPERICAVIFTQGCPWRCPFCHNPELVIPDQFEPCIDTEAVFDHLIKRRAQLDGLTISGGEPTLQPDLAEFCAEVKELDMLVKLDTNGIHPKVVRNLIEDELIDFVAMDIKAGPTHYREITGGQGDWNKVAETLAVLKDSGIAYELRTTLIPEFHTLDVLEELRDVITGASRFALQAFRPGKCLDESYCQFTAPSPELILEVEALLKPAVFTWINRT